MKLLYCKKCGDLVKMERIVRGCNCGNCCGRYDKNGSKLELRIHQAGTANVVGINNDLLSGKFAKRKGGLKNGDYNGSLFQKENSHIVVVIPFTTGDVKPLRENWIKPVNEEREWKQVSMHNEDRR